jgi:hypothetical protein
MGLIKLKAHGDGFSAIANATKYLLPTGKSAR